MNKRLDYFMERAAQNRFAWFRDNGYLPQIYKNLEDWQWDIMFQFFEETEARNYIGEASIPIMSEMLGFINGSNLDGIVQCGHYAGWSTLMLGWALGQMGSKTRLFSIDIDAEVTTFARDFVKRAGLEEVVRLEVGDSADANMVNLAVPWLNQQPNFIFIDSSHQYAHTLRELNTWFPHLQKGGLIFLHDISIYAMDFDSTNEGGVHRAIADWTVDHSVDYIGLNGNVVPNSILVRQDGCGAGIIQK